MRIVSLFCGAGGLDLGLIKSGHTIIWANDNDSDAVQTYRANLNDHVVCADIADIPSSSIPDADVVVGGFPCQGFSQANLLRRVEDERNKLYIHFSRVVRDKRPQHFLAENVRGILSLDKGRAIEQITEDFASVGYRVKHSLFNMADYGVPQTRQRVIITGTRDDLSSALEFQFPIPTYSRRALDKGLLPWVSISAALRDIPEPNPQDPDMPNHVYSKYKVTNRDFTGHRTTDPSKPSPTILARGNGKGGVCAIQHPKNHRRMSIREQATIQTFPLDFVFHGKMNSCYRQVGNAVPVLFAERLGQQLALLERLSVTCV